MNDERRSGHRTQWAAQFAVASELCKLNYQVALTLGNHPAVDLMAISPNGQRFSIEVKGLYKPNYWQARKQTPRDGLVYVFAYSSPTKCSPAWRSWRPKISGSSPHQRCVLYDIKVPKAGAEDWPAFA